MSKFCHYPQQNLTVTQDTVRCCNWVKDVVGTLTATSCQQVLEFAPTDWTVNCVYCWNQEEQGIKSPRLKGLENMAGVVNQLTTVTLDIDTTCNAVCLMCSPEFSTAWGKYQARAHGLKSTTDLQNSMSVNARLEQIKSSIDFTHVQQLNIGGGEPLLSNSHLQLLKLIPDPTQVTVRYITNGSVLPTEEVLIEWAKFKQVQIVFSLDSIGSHFEYLRWPLEWSQVESNIKSLLTMPGVNFEFRTNFTLTPFNLLDYPECWRWANAITADTAHYDHIWFKNPLGANNTMSLRATPPGLKQTVSELYGKDHIIYQLIPEFDENCYQSFMRYVQYHDQLRQTSWREVFPQLVKYFD